MLETVPSTSLEMKTFSKHYAQSDSSSRKKATLKKSELSLA